MTVLVGSLTPFTIWKINGGLIGACRNVEEAKGIIRDLKASFPDNEYQVMGPGQGDELEVYHDSRSRCPHCDDTGDVHRADGEWLGSCDCKSQSIVGFECRDCSFSYPSDAATRHCGGCGEPLTVKKSAHPQSHDEPARTMEPGHDA